MATIQDIFDWLNQGAQGDIPGTGGSQPSPSASSQSAQPASDQSEGATPVAGKKPAAATSPDHTVWTWNPYAVPNFAGLGKAVDDYRTAATGATTEPTGPPDEYLGKSPWIPSRMAPDIGIYGGGAQQTTGDPVLQPDRPLMNDYWKDWHFNQVPLTPDDYYGVTQGPFVQAAAQTPGYSQGAQTAPVATPGDYSGNIPPTLLPQYQSLIKGGLPPAVAYSILTQPSVGEGERPSFAPWPYPYQGSGADAQARAQDFPQHDPLEQHMWDQYYTRQQNLPTWEGHTPGEDDSLGFNRLPSGQYVPALPYVQPPSSGSGWDEHNQTIDDTTLNDMLSNPDFMQLLLGSR